MRPRGDWACNAIVWGLLVLVIGAWVLFGLLCWGWRGAGVGAVRPGAGGPP